MKRKLISLMTAVTMIMSLFGAMPITASAADVSASSIKLGDYVTMGGIKWRCVAFEKATGNVIDSTNTSQTYKDGYLPLMLADTSISYKQFDAEGGDISGSHGRDDNRITKGSSYWGDSNIRDWLNSDSSKVTYTCGNKPSYASEAGFLTKFNAAEKAAMRTVTQKSLLAEADKNVLGASGKAVLTYNQNITDVVQNYTAAYSEQVTDTMFLLDVRQVYNVYQNLGGYYKLSSNYCLRSPNSRGNRSVRVVYSNGAVGDYYANSIPGVRPAFFLNPSAKFVCGDGTSDAPYRLSHITLTGKDENEHYTYCSRCGQEFSRGEHTYRSNYGNGTQHICTECGYSENHTYDENNTCTVCGHKHTYTANDSKHTCSDCGYSEKHTYDENHICTVCNHACSHSRDYQYQTTTGHYKVCSDCGRRTDTEPHKYQQKTGDKTYHYCSVCNYSQNHSFGAYVVVGNLKKRDCSICGYQDMGEYEKPNHAQPHNLCCDDTCTEHETIEWYIVFKNDNLIDTINKRNQCMVPAFTLSEVWEMPNTNTDWTFSRRNKVDNCLYANTLTLSNGAYINIKNGQTYSLTDCYKGLGTVTGGTNGVIKIENGGAFNFFEGTITGNSGTGGIIENSGTTNIYGGTITGNTGTVIKNSGTLNIYGGAITNNTGAAIENSGTVNIYGGTITNNAGGGIIGTGTINFKEGNPVIESNTVDNVICNVKGANTITVTALGEEASVGFTPATAVTAGNPKEISANGGEYYSRFVSDNGDYAIIQNGNGIQLIAAHSVLEHHAAKAATCTEGGNDEYWSCKDCNRLYSDKDGNTEIYSVPETEATGHSITHHEEKAATCTAGGNREYWECTACGNVFEDEEATREIDGIPAIDATGHRLTPHEAQAATCTEDGNSAYWECMGCDKLFSDENGTTETTLENTVINATGHKWGAWTETKPATETEDGEKSRTCSACGESETQVIPATGHTCDWGDWEIKDAPTDYEPGWAQRVCQTNAAHTESAFLPVLTDTTVWTYEETKAPTQDTDGEGKYTSVYGEVKITLPATGADKFSIRYEGGNAIVNAPTAGTYTVLFAAYNGSGRLTSLSAQTVTVEKGETTVEPQGFTTNGAVKVMLWESMLSMKPLCTADEQVSLAE